MTNLTNLANSDGSDHEVPMPTEAEVAQGRWLTTADKDFASVWKSISPAWR